MVTPAHQDKRDFADVCACYRGVSTVVLGASGFIGRWVARALSRCGARLSLVVRNPVEAETVFARYGIDGDIVQLDLGADPGELESLCRRLQPALVFNLAGYGVDRSERDESLAYRINEQLVRTLCQAMVRSRDESWPGQAVVHVGSALEYGEIGGDLSEESEPNPTTLYGQSKLAGTRALAVCCKENGLKAVSARLFTVYGPGEHEGRLVPSLLQSATENRALELTAGMQKRDFTYVEDVAEGLLRLGLADTLRGQVINLASGHLQTVRQFIEEAADVLAIPTEHLRFGRVPTRSEEMEHLPVSIERMRCSINWSPVIKVQQGIRETAEFFEREGVK